MPPPRRWGAAPALVDGFLPTSTSAVTAADESTRLIATASSQACTASENSPLALNLRLGDLDGDGKDDLLLTSLAPTS